MKPRSHTRAGFSLVEVALALAVFASVGVALVGILGTSLNVTRETLSEAEKAMLVENIQARLMLDVEWPGKQPDGEPPEVWYDDSGAEVAEEKLATFRVTFRPINGGGFTSDYFESWRVVIERLPQRQSIGTWTLQRARLAQGRPVTVQK